MRGAGETTKTRQEGSSVTQLVELCVHSGRARNKTDQSGFEEGGPAVDQTPLPPDVILDEDTSK